MTTTTIKGIWETESCGIPLKFPCPTTTDDFDRLAGYVGAQHHAAVQYIGLHDTLPDWQEKFATKVEALTKIPRLINEDATAKLRAQAKNPAEITPVKETVKKYMAKVMARSVPERQAEIRLLAQTIASETPVDPSPTARKTVIAKENYARAESLLSAPPDHYEGKLSEYSDYVGGFIVDRDDENKPIPESVARLIQMWFKKKDQETLSEFAMKD